MSNFLFLAAAGFEPTSLSLQCGRVPAVLFGFCLFSVCFFCSFLLQLCLYFFSLSLPTLFPFLPVWLFLLRLCGGWVFYFCFLFFKFLFVFFPRINSLLFS